MSEPCSSMTYRFLPISPLMEGTDSVKGDRAEDDEGHGDLLPIATRTKA
jgi:hypothetical protein